nr:ATP-grasp domain-containing protein [uncultured Agathobaculum sp.]
MKKIMILGAGIYQVPLIKAAKKLGCYTIVASIPGNYPGFKFADKIYYEDTTNYDRILTIAQSEKIDGIVTAGTDVAVLTIGKVCDALGLKGLSFESAKIASNKVMMKKAFEEYGVRTARFREVPFDFEIIKKEVENLSLPLMFKAVDSSGSRGIIRVNCYDEFPEAMEYTRNATKLDYFIIEEFVEGEEFGAQAFVLDGEIQFILPHGDYVFKGDTGVPVGHYAPYAVSEAVLQDTGKQLTNAIYAMKLNNCAINADFILSNGEVYVLEIGGRSGATCLAELTSIYFNFDYYEKMLKVALGEDVQFGSHGHTANASMLLTSVRSGKIVKQQFEHNDNPDIVEIQFDYNVGDYVNAFRVGPDRIGHVITKGGTLEQAVDLLNNVLGKIEIEIE